MGRRRGLVDRVTVHDTPASPYAGDPARVDPDAERIVRRSALIAYAAVGVAAVVGWVYLAAMVAAMLPAMDMAELGPGMGFLNRLNGFSDLPDPVRAALAALCLPGGATGFGMPQAGGWGAWDLLLVYLMWLMMVCAMMLPSAAPVLAFDAARYGGIGADAARRALAAVVAAGAGYFAVWAGYSVLATGAQWVLNEARLATPMMAPASAVLAGTTLLAAGIYQFTPAKRACLMRCRVPAAGAEACAIPVPPEVTALEGGALRADAFRRGVRQGLDCMGCCWALMAVMFAVGVMNILWIGVLGVVMVLEKLRRESWISPAIGGVLCLWGAALLAASGRLPAFF